MHLITLSALRQLISGVDITPSIIRQVYFFHFITSLTIYVHLITISHLRQFPSVVYISLYLFISDFFFIVLHPSIIQRTHLRCTYLTSTCYFMNFGVISFPHSIAKFLLYQTHLKPTLFTCGPPMLLCRDRKGTRLPWIWQDWQ